ncbi:MAG: TetR family transcriptional regulator, partial [Solirubrobacteraceae bacterium]
ALLRDTLLDAARRELEQRAWSEVTMADVAVAAGVSRQTLYKEFGSREAFAQAFVLREADRFIVAVETALDAHLDDPIAALTAAFGLFLTAAAEDPLIRAAITGTGEMLPFVTTQGQPLVQGAAERLSVAILARWPQAAPDDAALLAECLVRLGISYVALPVGPAGMTAASIAQLLGPYIERALQP